MKREGLGVDSQQGGMMTKGLGGKERWSRGEVERWKGGAGSVVWCMGEVEK